MKRVFMYAGALDGEVRQAALTADTREAAEQAALVELAQWFDLPVPDATTLAGFALSEITSLMRYAEEPA